MARGTVIKAIPINDDSLVFKVSGSGEQIAEATRHSDGMWHLHVGESETLHRSKSSMMKALRFAPVRSK